MPLFKERRQGMLGVAGEEIETLAIDPHGILASTCKELKTASCIDEKKLDNDRCQIVSRGQAVIAMILNGLDFFRFNSRYYPNISIRNLANQIMKGCP